MKFVLLLALVAVVGCESPGPVRGHDDDADGSRAALNEKPAPEIFFAKKQAPFTFTGRNLIVVESNFKSDLKKCLSTEDLRSLKADMTQYLKAQGFKIVDKARRAHTELIFSCDEAAPFEMSDVHQEFLKLAKEIGGTTGEKIEPLKSAATPVVVETTTSKFEDGKLITETHTTYHSDNWRRLAFVFKIHEYGRREKAPVTLAVSAEKSKWESLQSQIKTRLFGELKGLNLMAPTDDLKMAGDPACQPRFGYLAPSQIKDGQAVFIVSEIVPNSPAKVAGMRVGDQLLALDSQEYDDNALADSVYDVKTPVPLKLSRNGQVIRTSIRSQIICP